MTTVAESLGFDPIQLLTLTGAAGAFFLFIKWIADGKFHSHSEVEGLRQDKVELLAVNKEQAAALKASNDLLAKVLDTLKEIRDDMDTLQKASRRRGPGGAE